MNHSSPQYYTITTRECLFLIIRGDMISNTEEFLQILSLGLEFPTYFGQNKDALFDMLSDLTWLPQDEICVIMTQAEEFFSNHPQEQAELKTIFNEATENQLENKVVKLYFADLHEM